MGKPIIIKNAYIEVNGVNLSDYCDNVEVQMSKPEVDLTTFGKGRQRGHGLDDDSFTLNFKQSFDAGAVNATVRPLYKGEVTFPVKVRPKGNLPVSASNPSYEGEVDLFEYTPLSAGVGEASESSLSLPVNGAIEEVTT